MNFSTIQTVRQRPNDFSYSDEVYRECSKRDNDFISKKINSKA